MNSPDWPALPFDEWEKTCDTIHMWTQIVGKTRMAFAPLENHWWNVVLYVTPLGLTTGSVPYHEMTFEIRFDFVSHCLTVRTSEGRGYLLPMYPRSVADFYAEYVSAMKSLGIEVKINRKPVEFDDSTPFDEDGHHASYDKECIERFRRILVHADRILKEFRAPFVGKCSPVHFFWGSFDLAVTRFSGRRAAERPGTDAITREAYSDEVISCGFWPGDRRFKHAAFYSYTAPTPPELKEKPVLPRAAYWDQQLGEFILKYDDVRAGDSPEKLILDFCQSTYEAGATAAGWDRNLLERHR